MVSFRMLALKKEKATIIFLRIVGTHEEKPICTYITTRFRDQEAESAQGRWVAEQCINRVHAW